MKKYVFIDCDGTLTLDGVTIPESAKQAITLAKENGHEMILTTGRSPEEIDEEIESLHFDGYILDNGKYISYHGEVINEFFIDEATSRNLISYFQNNHMDFRLETNAMIYQTEGFAKSFDTYWRFGESEEYDYTLINAENCNQNDIHTIYVITRQEQLNAITQLSEGYGTAYYNTTDKNIVFCRIDTIGVDKGVGINLLLKKLGLSKENTISIGDSPYDFPMFAATEFSCGIGNSNSIIRNNVDYMSDSVNQDGLYKAFLHFKLID